MPTARGQGGKCALALGREPAGRLELRLQLGKALVEHAHAGQAHVVDVELELAARLVDRRRGPDLDRDAVAQRKRDALRALAEHHAAHLRLRVLQVEVAVSRRGACEIGDFAADPHEAEMAFDEKARGRDQQADRHDRAGAHRRRVGPGRSARIGIHAFGTHRRRDLKGAWCICNIAFVHDNRRSLSSPAALRSTIGSRRNRCRTREGASSNLLYRREKNKARNWASQPFSVQDRHLAVEFTRYAHFYPQDLWKTRASPQDGHPGIPRRTRGFGASPGFP